MYFTSLIVFYPKEISMKVIGIVSEYNPFHNGHKFHLELSKKLCEAEYSITIMSGNFLQRGEPALFDKWTRAKMAVLNGIDLVIELPVVYSCQVAELFALGAVKILNSLGIIDYLCFGSENGGIEDLYNISNILLNEPEEIKQEVKDKMSWGMTYSKAIGDTYKDHYGDILSYPNNVLGIEYIKSIILLNSSIKPVTTKRLMNNYSDKNFTGSISSATAIREELRRRGLTPEIRKATPQKSWSVMQNNIENGRGPIFWENFSDILLYELRKSSVKSMRYLPEVKEGIEFRLKKSGIHSTSFEEIITMLKTKRYTRTSLQRTLCHMLISMNKEDLNYAKLPETPAYIRILAFNNKGRELLREINSNTNYEIINKPANFKSQSPYLNRMFSLDTISTDTYNLGYTNESHKKAGDDYRTSPFFLNELK